MVTDGRYDTLSKKEIARNEKEKRKLQKNLDGIRNMGRLPDAIFIVDTKKEKIAVDEARKLKIPVVGIVDTNCDPDEVDFVIPGNDDALRAIRLFASKIADAVLNGRGLREAVSAEDRRGRGRRDPAPRQQRRRARSGADARPRLRLSAFRRLAVHGAPAGVSFRTPARGAIHGRHRPWQQQSQSRQIR